MVQLCLTDPVARVTRPITQLIGFARVALDPCRARTVAFDVHAERFAYVSADLDWIV